MLTFLVWVLVLLVAVALVLWLLETFPLTLSPMAKWIMRAIVVIAALIFLAVFVGSPQSLPHWPR